MITQDLIDLLKHCLNEPKSSEDQFTSPELLRLLNRGLSWLQSKMLLVNSNAIMAADSVNLVQGSNLLPMPPGHLRIMKAIRISDGVQLYKRRPPYMDYTYGPLKGSNLTVGTFAALPTDWTMFGRYMRIGPTPNASAPSALMIEYVPSISLPADNPNYVPDVADPLLDIVVNKAWCMGLRPSADVGQIATATKALQDSLADFDALCGLPDSTELIPDFDEIDGYFDETSATTSNGIDSR